MNFFVPTQTLNGTNLAIIVFYTERAFQRHLIRQIWVTTKKLCPTKWIKKISYMALATVMAPHTAMTVTATTTPNTIMAPNSGLDVRSLKLAILGLLASPFHPHYK